MLLYSAAIAALALLGASGVDAHSPNKIRAHRQRSNHAVERDDAESNFTDASMLDKRGQTYTGVFTWYELDRRYAGTTGPTGSVWCGGVYHNSDRIVAMNAAQANKGWCGRTITLSYNGRTASGVQVVDYCPPEGEHCGYGGLDLSPSVFSELADMGQGVLRGAQWWFEDEGGPAPQPEPKPEPEPEKPKPTSTYTPEPEYTPPPPPPPPPTSEWVAPTSEYTPPPPPPSPTSEYVEPSPTSDIPSSSAAPSSMTTSLVPSSSMFSASITASISGSFNGTSLLSSMSSNATSTGSASATSGSARVIATLTGATAVNAAATAHVVEISTASDDSGNLSGANRFVAQVGAVILGPYYA